MRYTIVAALVALAGLALVLGQAPPANDEGAVRAAIDAYTAAFNKGDLDGLLAHLAADADFVDDNGKQYKGKAEVGDVLKRALADLKGHVLKSTIKSLHFLRPDVVIADGTSEITTPDGATDSGRFTSTWTKIDGKWLLSSVRDLPDSPAASEPAPAPLQQLAWLVGDWTSENPTFSVRLSARWALNKNFLLLEYTVKGKANEDLTVAQYIGWDPVEGVLHSWFFDSQGGFGGGDWEREGNTWTAAWSGVLPEGQTASSTNSMSFIDDTSFLFHSVDRDVDGLPLADV